MLYIMGCFDVYCLLCGNPCHGLLPGSTKIFLENINYYKEKYIIRTSKKNQFYREKLKILYDYYSKNPDFLNTIKEYEKLTTWMNDCTFLTVQNKIIPNCKEISCANYFVDKNKNHYTHLDREKILDENSGIFVHTDCWKYVKTKLKITLNFSSFPFIEYYTPMNIVKYFNEKYQSQDFDFFSAIIENSDSLLNPNNKSSTIKKQIDKVIIQLKLRGGGTRKSPINSATFYKANTYKIGQDNNIWVIKGGKWVPLKKDEVTKINIVVENNFKSLNKLVKKLVFIGQPNISPAFIINQENAKKNIKFEIISSNDLVPYFQKLDVNNEK